MKRLSWIILHTITSVLIRETESYLTLEEEEQIGQNKQDVEIMWPQAREASSH